MEQIQERERERERYDSIRIVRKNRIMKMMKEKEREGGRDVIL